MFSLRQKLYFKRHKDDSEEIEEGKTIGPLKGLFFMTPDTGCTWTGTMKTENRVQSKDVSILTDLEELPLPASELYQYSTIFGDDFGVWHIVPIELNDSYDSRFPCIATKLSECQGHSDGCTCISKPNHEDDDTVQSLKVEQDY